MPELNTLNWADLATSDTDAATAFYCAVLGWEAEPVPMPEGHGDYVMLHKGGRRAGALFELPAEKLEQFPPHWKCYVSVENADATVAHARELGGVIHMEPFDLGEAGRMAIIQDPTGGFLAVWQAGKHKGADLFGEPGGLCWMELLTNDTEAASVFYNGVFGWTAKSSEVAAAHDYIEFHVGGRGVAGMMPMPQEAGAMPPRWTPYFVVADLGDTVSTADAHGGSTVMPPMEIAGVGRFAWLNDPQGATFAVIQVS